MSTCNRVTQDEYGTGPRKIVDMKDLRQVIPFRKPGHNRIFILKGVCMLGAGDVPRPGGDNPEAATGIPGPGLRGLLDYHEGDRRGADLVAVGAGRPRAEDEQVAPGARDGLGVGAEVEGRAAFARSDTGAAHGHDFGG